jgi:hypothetical protein
MECLLSVFYLLCLAAFSVLLLFVLYEAIVSVSRKPVWVEARLAVPASAPGKTAQSHDRELTAFVSKRRNDEWRAVVSKAREAIAPVQLTETA